MTISTDPWKLFRIAFALAAVSLMLVKPVAYGPYDPGQDEWRRSKNGQESNYPPGCQMTAHQE
jgi:hypothetical protein